MVWGLQMMAKHKANTHAKKRIKQRFHDLGRDPNDLARSAYICGLEWDELPEGLALREMLLTKAMAGKIVKAYDGYVFVFSKNSHNMITMYAIQDESMLAELDSLKEIIKQKREEYRAARRGMK